MIEPWKTLLESLERQLPRIERCLDRLDDDSIWSRPRPELNSVANLCLHLAGNESHYIGHAIGGSGYRRDRSAEFTARGGLVRAGLLERLHAARGTTRATLAGLGPDDATRPVAVDHPPNPTVLSVVTHVAEHYAWHAGQIVLLTRLLQSGSEPLLEWRH